MRIIIATSNKGKVRELSELLDPLDIELIGMSEYPDIAMPEETERTFEGNSLLKAYHVARETGLPVIGDDSGLEVDALFGGPGVKSARYAGLNATDQENNNKLLKQLLGTPLNGRTARFRCVLSLVDIKGNIKEVFTGRCEGIIATKSRGKGGFGYDPIFLPVSHHGGKTMAELTPEEKNAISHRGEAMEKLVSWLKAHISLL